jgi:uncharacterized lipoprotein YbaY
MSNSKRYVHFDGMTWPLPDMDEDGAQWRLHYQPQSLTATDRYYLSSIISAYGQMVFDPVKKRQRVVRSIRKAMLKNRSAE